MNSNRMYRCFNQCFVPLTTGWMIIRAGKIGQLWQWHQPHYILSVFLHCLLGASTLRGWMGESKVIWKVISDHVQANTSNKSIHTVTIHTHHAHPLCPQEDWYWPSAVMWDALQETGSKHRTPPRSYMALQFSFTVYTLPGKCDVLVYMETCKCSFIQLLDVGMRWG